MSTGSPDLEEEPGSEVFSASPPQTASDGFLDSALPQLPRHLFVPSYVRTPPIEAVVFVWGVNEDYQLGLENPADQSRPKVLDAMLGVRLQGRGFLSRPIVTGSRNSLAIDAYGQVYTWGWNARGTLGNGNREKVTKPKKVAPLAAAKIRIVQAAIGGWHCLAVSDQGQVFAWGGNEYEQCGLETQDRDIIVPIQVLPRMRVRQVAAGGMHSVALTYEGEVWTWGEPWGEFALNLTRKPRRVAGVDRAIKVSCGAFHNLALSAEGSVYSWGTNDYGQLGSGDTSYSNVARAVAGMDLVRAVDITCGGWHSGLLSDAGEAFVWGRGEYGRLGVGDRSGSSKLRPHRVEGIVGHVITELSCGGTHTLALTLEGRVFVWGRADYGRLGLADAAVKDLYSPVEIPMPGGSTHWKVISVSAGGRHSVCLALPDRSDEETDRRSSRQTTGPGSVGEMVPVEDLAGLPFADGWPSGFWNGRGASERGAAEDAPPSLRGASGGEAAGVGTPRLIRRVSSNVRVRGEGLSGLSQQNPFNREIEGTDAAFQDIGVPGFEEEDEEEEQGLQGDVFDPITGHRTELDRMIEDLALIDPRSGILTHRAPDGSSLSPPSKAAPHPGGSVQRTPTGSSTESAVLEGPPGPELSPIRPLPPPRADSVSASRTNPRTSAGGAPSPGLAGPSGLAAVAGASSSGTPTGRGTPGLVVPATTTGFTPAAPAQATDVSGTPGSAGASGSHPRHPPPMRKVSAIQLALERSGELEEEAEDIYEDM